MADNATIRTAAPIAPSRAGQGTAGLLVIAWVGTIAISHAPHVVLSDALGLGDSAVPWLWLSAAAVVALLSTVWRPARTLVPYFTVMLTVVFLAGVVLPTLGAWLPLEGTSELTQAVGHKSLLVIVALAMAVVVARTAAAGTTSFVTPGDVRARSGVRLPGRRQPLSWAVLGPVTALLLGGGFAAAIAAEGVFGAGAGDRLLSAAPLILAAATFNAFGEEVLYRAAPLSRLVTVVGPGQAVLLTAVWFGLGHYDGSVPSGLEGVVMSGLLGLVLGNAMVATRGLAWPVVIHIALDVVIFASLAAGAT